MTQGEKIMEYIDELLDFFARVRGAIGRLLRGV